MTKKWGAQQRQLIASSLIFEHSFENFCYNALAAESNLRNLSVRHNNNNNNNNNNDTKNKL
jgi:hypothetical protein